jgi:hypothetical protein
MIAQDNRRDGSIRRLAGTFRGPFGSNDVFCNSFHAIRQSRPEPSFNLLRVRCRVASREDDTLRQFSPALRDGLKCHSNRSVARSSGISITKERPV